MVRPIHRRRRLLVLILSGLALVLAALAVRWSPQPPTEAREEGPYGGQFRPFFFIHAGDPQIPAGDRLRDTTDRFIHLARLANELNPAFVLVAGDLVDSPGDAKQIAARDEALREFHVPVKLIRGNHDDPDEFRRRFGHSYHAFAYNGCKFFCLDSSLLVSSDDREAKAHWGWLEAALKKAQDGSGRPVFIAMHEPPYTMGEKQRIERLFRDNGVRQVLAGHVHRTAETQEDGFTVFTVGGTYMVHDKRGFGYRVFRVSPEGVQEKYFTLDSPMDDVREWARGQMASSSTQP